MKRVLLASTALGLGAGMAAAQDMGMMDGPALALSGSAEMGVAGSKDDSVRFHTDIDITFKATGTMDSGVTWSADVDLDEGGSGAAAHANDDDDGGVTIAISQPDGFGTLTMGDTDGGYDWAMTELPGGGLRDEVEHAAHSGNGGLDGDYDGQVLRYDRAIAAGFSFGASVELDDDTGGTEGSDVGDPIIGLGGKYEMGMGAGTLSLGGGYQTGGYRYSSDDELTPIFQDFETTAEINADVFGGSAKMDFGGDAGGIAVTLNASMGEIDASHSTTGANANTETLDGEFTHGGAGLEYTVGAVSLAVNVGSLTEELTYDPSGDDSGDRLIGDATTTGVGFGASYDLGGGAALKFGIGNSETEFDYTREADGTNPANTSDSVTEDSNTDAYKWSLGVAFSF